MRHNDFIGRTLQAAKGKAGETRQGGRVRTPRAGQFPPPRWDKRAFNATELFRRMGLLGEMADEKEGKRRVVCPWSHEHADPPDIRKTETVIYAGKKDESPGFDC